MLFNTVVFVLVLRVLIKHYLRKLKDLESKKKFQGTFKTLISVVSIMFMFGLQWLFGAFTIAEASEAFQWLFVIFSTLQGLFLFLYFCILAQDAREQWLKLLSWGHHASKQSGAVHSHSNQSNQKSREHRNKYLSATSSQDYDRRNVSGNISSSHLPSSRSSSVSNERPSALEMASRRNKLLAMPPSIAEVRETEFVITNENVCDRVSSDSDAQEEEVEKVYLECTTIPNTGAMQQPMVEVPPHILERRFMRCRNPPQPHAVEKIDLSLEQNSPRSVTTSEPTFEVPPYVLESRSHRTQHRATDDRSSLSKEDDDDDFERVASDVTDYYDVDFGDLEQLMDFSFLTAEDLSDFEEMTSYM